MKRILTVALATICSSLVLAAPVIAGVTVSASPNPAVVGQNVKIVAGATFTDNGISCGITVNYGDGSSPKTKNCSGIACTFVSSHTFSSSSIFTVQASGFCGNGMGNVLDPKTASVMVQVKTSPTAPLPTASAAGTFTLIAAPATTTVPRGQSSIRQVAYRISGAPAGEAGATSPRGEFRVGGEIVAINELPIAVSLAGGTGSGFETVVVPVRVVEIALQRGSNRVEYVRPFRAGSVTAEARVTLVVTTVGAAEFELRRFELSFENRQAEAIVPRNAVVPIAYADIGYRGSGWLEGYWESDGAVLSHVRRYLGPEGRVRVMTPKAPALQSFNTGTHVVRFVVVSPPPAFPLPAIVYIVPPGEGLGTPFSLDLVDPRDGAQLDPAPLRLSWSGGGAATLFLVEFSKGEGDSPVFSAFTPETSYLLPVLIFDDVFTPGARYTWQVTGYDAEGRVRSESPVRTFSFKR